jgi:hypothetical protein
LLELLELAHQLSKRRQLATVGLAER